MAIPDYQTLMLPLMRLLERRGATSIADATEALAVELGLSESDLAAPGPGGRGATVLKMRTGWARTYLVQAGLLRAVRRGVVELTDRGRDVLATTPTKVTTADLQAYPEFRAFQQRSRPNGPTKVLPEAAQPSATVPEATTPDEQITTALAAIEAKLREDLLTSLLQAPPDFFERVVVDLLLGMGYGNTAEDAGEALGKTGDGGIDGVIREDRLGLDLIYVQAKRYAADNVVQVDAIRSFAGSLDFKGARKGVFITTGRFTANAHTFTEQLAAKRIVLIDGERLTRLMLRHDVGVRPDRTIVLKRLDLDYFEPDDA